MNPTRRYYVILLLLVVVFAAPGLSAYLLYRHPQWLSSATINRGQLIRPPHRVNALSDDSKWRLLLWSPEACGSVCAAQLDHLARIRVAWGRRLYDVDAGLMQSAQSGALSSTVAGLLKAQGMRFIPLSDREFERLSKLYQQPQFFIANSDGFLVLVYPVTSPSDDLFRDIKQLLIKGSSN